MSREKVIFRKSNSFGEFKVQNLNKSKLFWNLRNTGSKKIDFSIVEQKVDPLDIFVNMSDCDFKGLGS
jgi:hypothetical protein